MHINSRGTQKEQSVSQTNGNNKWTEQQHEIYEFIAVIPLAGHFCI